MGGIAGWLDYRQDLRPRRAIVEAMTDTLAHRGPDGTGAWLSEHALIGHRRLRLTDPGGVCQPAVASVDGRELAVAAFDGAVYNIAEIRASLAATGHPVPEAGDAAVLGHAYLAWGTDFVARLDGMFAVVVWDIRRSELLLARDRLGMKPMAYQPTEAGLLFGSEAKALLAHPEVQPIVHADGLRELFAHFRSPGQQVYRGMADVKPGHVLTVSPAGCSQTRYWSLPVRSHRVGLPETVATVREMVEAAVRRQFDPAAPAGVLLSGGIDSSALTAWAARLSDEPVRTFSMNLVGYLENFQPHQTMRATPDAPFVTMVAEHVGSAHTEILLDTNEIADPAVHRAATRCQDRPTPFGDMDASLFLLLQRLSEHVPAVLSGEAADDLFNGYFWAYDEKLSSAGTFPWLAFERSHAAARAGLGCGLVDEQLRKELDFTGYADQRYREALSEVPLADGESAAQQRARTITYLVLTRWLPTHLDRADRLSMAAGTQLRAPYCDQSLVEYLYNVPAAYKRKAGEEKSLLRDAAEGILPSQVVHRPKSAYPTSQDGGYARRLHARFTELMRTPDAPVHPLVDGAAARLVTGDQAWSPEGAHAWGARANVEMLLQLNTWLTDNHVTLDL